MVPKRQGAKYHPIPRGAIKIAVPDTTQQTGYSCGASSLQAVCRFYGVGRDNEVEFVRDLKSVKMDPRVGAHPYQIKAVAKKYGLEVSDKANMSIPELKKFLRKRRPVLLMIQAWATRKSQRNIRYYSRSWEEGHWVVAVGYDEGGVFFEDPSLEAIRGYLSHEELALRWKDTGPRGRHIRRYGLAIWKQGKTQSAYTSWAQPIR